MHFHFGSSVIIVHVPATLVNIHVHQFHKYRPLLHRCTIYTSSIYLYSSPGTNKSTGSPSSVVNSPAGSRAEPSARNNFTAFLACTEDVWWHLKCHIYMFIIPNRSVSCEGTKSVASSVQRKRWTNAFPVPDGLATLL